MASLASRPRHSVQTYWARRNYYRRLRVARLGGGRNRPAGAGSALWKKKQLAVAVLRLRAAIALALLPARQLLVRLRDAYIDAMLALPGRPCAALARTRSCGALAARRVPRARTRRGSGGGDFDRRMMAHIYNMVVTPEVPACAGKA